MSRSRKCGVVLVSLLLILVVLGLLAVGLAIVAAETVSSSYGIEGINWKHIYSLSSTIPSTEQPTLIKETKWTATLSGRKLNGFVPLDGGTRDECFDKAVRKIMEIEKTSVVECSESSGGRYFFTPVWKSTP